ncbi:N-acetylglucosamine kinase [Paradesertivirga mongoliensis]|uniref:N-acetylglucosamine kinase n=1 Tax=Paradesertivirga mongoliensis TaxID=2100740 RepID=A0ABW4ZRQ4_9SPHI|nr:N-acetylglucosamine kinase [Pedobacter mongoliensis]
MILIADSGSTKTTWSLLKNGSEVLRFDTEGYNPYFVSGQQISNSLLRALDVAVNISQVSAVYFYGAGCDGERSNIVKGALENVFWKAEVCIYSDLLAAGRGLLNADKGFVAILGTGSNTGLYDGKDIALNIDSLGFILGDEGSGAFIGKMVLRDYLRGQMPTEVRLRLEGQFGIEKGEVLYNVYSLPLANRYCARFCTVLEEDCLYSKVLLRYAFHMFFKSLVALYPDYSQYKFNCIGSVGYAFQSLLKEVAADYGMGIGAIERSPMDGLIEYYSQKEPA